MHFAAEVRRHLGSEDQPYAVLPPLSHQHIEDMPRVFHITAPEAQYFDLIDDDEGSIALRV